MIIQLKKKEKKKRKHPVCGPWLWLHELTTTSPFHLMNIPSVLLLLTSVSFCSFLRMLSHSVICSSFKYVFKHHAFNWFSSWHLCVCFCRGVREEGREKERERIIDVKEKHHLFASTGTEPATWPCALARNQTDDLPLCRSTPSQLSHASQGSSQPFKTVVSSLYNNPVSSVSFPCFIFLIACRISTICIPYYFNSYYVSLPIRLKASWRQGVLSVARATSIMSSTGFGI